MSLVRTCLDEGIPVVALVRTVFLDYWTADMAHAIVVVGYDDEHIYLNDPWFDDAPQRASISGFLAAWGEYNYLCGIIEQR